MRVRWGLGQYSRRMDDRSTSAPGDYDDRTMLSDRHRTIFSVSEDFFAAAGTELRAEFPEATIERIGPEAGRLTTRTAAISTVAEACRQRPIVFVRHLMRERIAIPVTEAGCDGTAVVGEVQGLVEREASGRQIALQVWSSGSSPTGFRADELWRAVAAALRERGYEVTRANQAEIVSVCMLPGAVHVGLNGRSEALVDWPGGRVGLARSPEQVSRSEFKLEELFKVFDISLPVGGTALDLGASPGGWARLLLGRGLDVWAVDPAALDSRIAGDPHLHHARMTAGPFLARTERYFDVVVNDMRMEPSRSCQVMLDAARRLRPGGLAIMTLKLSGHDPLEMVEASLWSLERRYDIVHARQLFHNRNEVSVVARRKEIQVERV